MKTPSSLKVHITRLEMTAPPKASLSVPVNIQTAIMRSPGIPLPFTAISIGRWALAGTGSIGSVCPMRS